MKLWEVISVDFDVIYQLSIRYSAFISLWVGDASTVGQYITCLWAWRKLWKKSL